MIGWNQGGTPSPWPPRRYGWVVELDDGSTVREIYDQPPLRKWDELDLDRVERLKLVDLWPNGEGTIATVDASQAELSIRGHELELLLGDTPLTGTQAADPDVDLVQFKQAYAEYSPATGHSRGLDFVVVGFDRELPGLSARVLVALHVPTRQVNLRLEFDGDEALGEDDVEVRLDGDVIEDLEAFRARVGPEADG